MKSSARWERKLVHRTFAAENADWSCRYLLTADSCRLAVGDFDCHYCCEVAFLSWPHWPCLVHDSWLDRETCREREPQWARVSSLPQKFVSRGWLPWLLYSFVGLYNCVSSSNCYPAVSVSNLCSSCVSKPRRLVTAVLCCIAGKNMHIRILMWTNRIQEYT